MADFAVAGMWCDALVVGEDGIIVRRRFNAENSGRRPTMSGAQSNLRPGENSWREYFNRQVERFQTFDEGSDSWSPHRPKPYVVEAAKEVAERSVKVMTGSVPQLIMAATSDGAIQLKWSKPERELSFVVSPDYTIDYLFITRDRASRVGGTVGFDEIEALVRRLIG
jgi:hypothetical protein